MPMAEKAEATRVATGFLGLVEPEAWSKWKMGPYVAWGFYGRADIANAAGLESIGPEGMQPFGDSVALPELLARFLVEAESLATR